MLFRSRYSCSALLEFVVFTAIFEAYCAQTRLRTHWILVAELEGAHTVFPSSASMSTPSMIRSCLSRDGAEISRTSWISCPRAGFPVLLVKADNGRAFGDYGVILTFAIRAYTLLTARLSSAS